MPSGSRPSGAKDKIAPEKRRRGRSLPFQTALTGGFLALAMVAGLIGVLGIYFIRAVAHERDVVAHQIAPAIESLGQIRTIVLHLAAETRLAVLDGPVTIAKLDNHKLMAAEEALIEARRTYESAVPHDFGRQMAEEIKLTAAKLGRSSRDVIGGKLASKPDALRQVLGELSDAEQQLISTIGRAVEFEHTNMRMGNAATANHLSIAVVFGAMQVAAAIAIALILGIKLGGPVTHASGALREATEKMGRGDYSARIKIRSTGILAGLTDAFNVMAAKVEHTHRKAEQRQTELNADLQRRIEAEQRLRHDALHDPLTKLANRAMLVNHLEQCIERARRSSDFEFALFFLDLDRFKTINDSLGHHVGDELLIEAASRLRKSVRALDTVVRVDKETTARLGGDEFAILVDGIKNPGRVAMIADRIQAELSRSFPLGGADVTTTASIGIAVGSRDYASANDMLRDADTAMYRAKLAGGGQHAMFDEAMHNDVKKRLRMENDLRRAVENQHFAVQYQPIMELATGRVVAFESLIRWIHPERGMIGSRDFISLAEETGLIVPIGRWILRQACRQLCAWRAQLEDDHPLAVSVNVSPRQVGDTNLVEEVECTIRETGINPNHLRIEITESMIMENARSINDVLYGLKELGVQLYMDDFGTGYSSLSCLHNFPLDVLKIDREFVMNITTDPQYALVIKAIMTLAHNLDLRVMAEGIETPEQLALVRDLGCEYGQGFYFAKPLDPGDAWAFITNDRRNLQSA